MKRLLVLFLLIYSSASFGQKITTPATQSIEAGTTVNVSDFVVNWANNTESLLISLSLEYQSTATFSLPTTTGLTRNYGYNSWTGINTLVFYGTRDNVNAALAAMTVTMGSVKTAVKINIEVSPFDVSYVYNPVNKHYYKYVASSQISYTSARTAASSNTFLGKTGYLVTITSQSEQDFVNNNIVGSNIWIAITDEATTTDGTWKLDGGPELGTIIKTQNGPTAGNIEGQYNNWCTGEPNGANHSEDYAVAKWNGGTCWNDLSNTNTGAVAGYIVEVSADFPSGSTYFTGVYSTYVVHNNDLAYTLASASSRTLSASNVSNLPNIYGGLIINDGNTITMNSSSTLNTNKVVFNGTGKMILTDNTSKWTPGASNLINTFIHSPSTNSTPSYWSVTSSWNNSTGSTGVGDSFYENAPYSGGVALHFTPYLNSPQGWSAQFNNTSQYLTLNYPVPIYMTGIVTQGRAYNGGQWVKSANVDVSIDGSTWTNVLSNVALNTNSTDAVTVLFPSVVYAKYVRLNPTDWNNHITMRMGVIIKSNTIVADGLVLHLDAGNPTSYKGTGTTWTDLSGNGNHSTLTNGPTYNIPNKGFLTFDGVDDYANGVAIPSTSGNNSRTVMVWYKSTANKNTILLDKGATTDDKSEQLVLVYTNGAGVGAGSYPPTNNGGIAVCFWGNDLIYPIAATTLFDGNWHFVAYTYDNSNTSVRICFDGNFATSVYHWNTSAWSTNSSKPFLLPRIQNTTNNPYLIGQSRAAFWGYGGTYSNVNIPLVQIYNRALTETEILNNFNTTRSRYGR
ncbi:discoidin domain-containing protein [Aquirufa sp. LEPPI-3A]|uniref:discoidin domain-containing protein n=1 Tax=Aquirufa regiilacus TaxID=3024868 RepID=UPI0028DDF4A0|nr:discoidin domain-containing protein [Aquirufa sp. LEPPI-3A]MDT8886739.1 discoidin domain-containing protein [Aquirufa sp. LEPPI-3A]